MCVCVSHSEEANLKSEMKRQILRQIDLEAEIEKLQEQDEWMAEEAHRLDSSSDPAKAPEQTVWFITLCVSLFS